MADPFGMPHAPLLRLLSLCAAFALATPVAAADSYDVGPGQPLVTIGAVPWATLAPDEGSARCSPRAPRG